MIKAKTLGPLLPVLLIAVLVVATARHAPPAVRLPLSVLVFLLAPGVACLGIPGYRSPADWAAVIGISLGVTLVLAEILVVSRHLFVLPYLWSLLGVVAFLTICAVSFRRLRVATPEAA